MQKIGPTARFLAAAMVAVLIVAACGGSDDDDAGNGSGSGNGGATADTSVSGSIAVSGSSTVEPISSAAAEAFYAENSSVDISVEGPGTGDGFQKFCNGEADIADASRSIRDSEIEACEAGGVEFIELKLAFDGISVLTNPSNPLECLSFADLYALIGPEAEGNSRWTDSQDLAAELGSTTEFPDLSLDITGPGEESGTYDTFIEIVLAGVAEERVEAGVITEDEAEQSRPDYQASANDNTIIQNIETSDGSLGWVGFAFAVDAADRVQSLAISTEPGGDCVDPSIETIADGSYPISRPLFIYVNKGKAEESEALAAFVDFYLGNLTEFVESTGYVVLPDDQASATAEVWEARTAGVQG